MWAFFYVSRLLFLIYKFCKRGANIRGLIEVVCLLNKYEGSINLDTCRVVKKGEEECYTISKICKG